VRSAFDGAVLGAFIGLGFQVFEDVIYVLTSAGGINTGESGAASTLATRLLTGFGSHAVYSTVSGWAWCTRSAGRTNRAGSAAASL
jgi:RsiW-degrading membrane proteinase PrsW (M82 family)